MKMAPWKTSLLVVLIACGVIGAYIAGIMDGGRTVNEVVSEPLVIEAAPVLLHPATVPESVKNVCAITSIQVYLTEQLVSVWGLGDGVDYSVDFTIADFPDEIAALKTAIETRIGD